MDAANLPRRTKSLRGFCSLAQRLLDADDHKNYARLMVSGVYNDEQYVVDPLLDRMRQDEPFEVSRDFDSLLGIADDIMVEDAITVFPVAKREDTLSVSIHLEHQFENSRESFIAPIHKVPNLCIAKWGVHNMIRVIIPELYDGEGRSPFLAQDEQRIFYEQGLRPAVASLCELPAAEWPATYNDEMFRARGRNGQLSFASKMLASWLVPDLGDAIRTALHESGISWGTGLVFLHQIRGVKHSTQHSVNPNASMNGLRAFLNHSKLPWRAISTDGTWFVDVGLEVSSRRSHCLAWRTDSHYHIVRRVIEGLSDNAAARITKLGSTMYARDIVSHLPAVSGCRITTGAARNDRNIVYLQMYTTDKALTYRPEHGHFGKYITPEDILKKKASPWITNLCELYHNAMRTGKSHARIEVRTTLHHAMDVLLNLNERILRNSLISVSLETWWMFRSFRATGFKFILQWQMEGDPEYCARESALVLLACCAWLLNSLHSAPDVGASWRALATTALPHVSRAGADPNILLFGTPNEEEEEESSDSEYEDRVVRVRQRRDATTLPAVPFGLIFTRHIRLGRPHPVPRLNEDPRYLLTEPVFKHIFGSTSEDLASRLLGLGVVRPRHPNRVANKISRVPAYHNWGQNPEGNIFSVAQHGAQIPLPVRDEGSDLEEEDMDEEVQNNMPEDPDEFTTKLWYGFLSDVTSLAPNQRNASKSSYTHLSEGERTQVNEATYMDNNLSAYFVDCQWKRATEKEWHLNFDKLFPPKGVTRSGAVQNFKKATYYAKWESFKAKADTASYNLVRNALYKRSKKLYWLPRAESDRLWYTKVHPKMRNLSGDSATKAAPRVLVRGSEPV